jgi:antitoxin component of RelBE/YafQ-DinJ toxin-antitoxin module
VTSDRKIEANRRNSRKSRGPRTAAGKATASRNALKHGLAALTHRHATPSAEVEEFARALCDDNSDPIVFAQAVQVAECELVLRTIRAHKIAVIERLRTRNAVPFASKNPVRQETDACVLESSNAERELKERLPKLVEQYKGKIEEVLGRKIPASANSYDEIVDWIGLSESDAIAIILDAISDESVPIDDQVHEQQGKEITANERDEHEALKAATLDLVRLERYEHRASSSKKRQIRELMKIKEACREGAAAEPGARPET